jgi:hypothetical protein
LFSCFDAFINVGPAHAECGLAFYVQYAHVPDGLEETVEKGLGLGFTRDQLAKAASWFPRNMVSFYRKVVLLSARNGGEASGVSKRPGLCCLSQDRIRQEANLLYSVRQIMRVYDALQSGRYSDCARLVVVMEVLTKTARRDVDLTRDEMNNQAVAFTRPCGCGKRYKRCCGAVIRQC